MPRAALRIRIRGTPTDHEHAEGSVYRQADDYDRGMPPYDPSTFPPFAVTVDLVVLTVRRHALCALVVRRGETPFQGRWALPGGFVRMDEDLGSAAARELVEETGLCAHDPAKPAVGNGAHLEQLATYGDPARDPRMRVVSVAHLALAPDLPAPRAGAMPTARAGRRSRICCTPAPDGRGSRRRRWPSTTRGSWPTEWSAPAPRSSTPRWPRRSARRNSRSASCAGCTKRCGAWSSIPVTSTARSPERPDSWCLPAGRPRDRAAGPRSCSGPGRPRCSIRRCYDPRSEPPGVPLRRPAERLSAHPCAKSLKCRVMLLRYPLPPSGLTFRERTREKRCSRPSDSPAPPSRRSARRERSDLRGSPGRVTALLGAPDRARPRPCG